MNINISCSAVYPVNTDKGVDRRNDVRRTTSETAVVFSEVGNLRQTSAMFGNFEKSSILDGDRRVTMS